VQSDSADKNTIASLVSGIINDLGDLAAGELRIAKAEFAQDLEKLKTTTVIFAVAAGLIGLGALLLLGMLVHLVHLYTDLPLWGCYGVVGFCSAGGGGLLLVRARAH
jgi:Putative Actinobacterial Holin-X, holin superfamily III